MDVSKLEPTDEKSLLAGVEVLELSSGVGGAYAGRLFAQLGASVRRFGPRIDLAATEGATPIVEEWLHVGKIALPPSAPLPSADSVVASCDLIVAEQDSLDPGFGAWVNQVVEAAQGRQGGPVVVMLHAGVIGGHDVPGTAITTSAWSGMSWAIGDADKAPLTLPYDLADYQAAAHACAAGLAALLADPAEPSLRSVEVAGRDVLAYFVGMITANFLPYERPWTRDGARPPGSAGVYPASIFPCEDGHVVFMCRSQREWDLLLEGMGSPEWSKDPKFADPRVVARLYADEADAHLVPWIAAQTKAELMAFGNANGLPVAPVRSIGEALDEEQFVHRDYFEQLEAPEGQLKMPTRPWRLKELAGDPTAVPRPWSVDGTATNASDLLRGLRVLDLSWVWSGPLTTSILADMGAEVLKIEHEGHMDTGRLRGKARRGGVEVDGPEHEATPYFNQMSHGKKSITLDIKTPEAQRIIRDLVEHCDIVVENMRPGALDKLGIGYEQLAAHNPAVVMLSMSMAGQTGPLKTMKGYAGIMAAMSGLESLIGYDEHNIVGSLSPALGDPNAAGHAMAVLLAALVRRKSTGRGTHIDLSQIEALVNVMPAPVAEAQLPEGVVAPANTHPRYSPHGHFPCAGDDQWVALAVRRDAEWEAILQIPGTAELLGREAWRHAEKRLADRDQVETALAAWTLAQDRDVLVQRLLDAGVAAAPVSSFEDMVASQWAIDRQLTVPVKHPYLGTTGLFTVPWKFGGTTAAAARPAPTLGANTVEVLHLVLGLPDDEIAELNRRQILR